MSHIRRHYWVSTPLLLILTLTTTSTYAADQIHINHLDKKLAGTLNQQTAGLAKNQKVALALGASMDDSFETKEITTDKYGNIHSRHQHKFMGIPVWGNEIVMHEKKTGEVFNFNGTYAKNIERDLKSLPSLSPKRSKQEALALAQRTHEHQRKNQKASFTYNNEHSDLFIYIGKDKKPRLVYSVVFFVESSEPSRPHLLIDANTLEIVEQWDGLTTDKIGTGPGGNGRVGQYEYGVNYGNLDVTQNVATCTTESADVLTVDMNNNSDMSGLTPFAYTCPRNTYHTVNGAYSPINDAHYFASLVSDMYNQWYHFKPIKDGKLVMKVHFSTDFENAFWNGWAMYFGDGGNTLYPLTSVDIIGHEVSHGFTEQHSGLQYAKQSGGINEAFSDMAGQALEYYLRGTNDWQPGADVFKDTTRAMRYMNNPPADGASIDNASQYNDNMNVHNSSGVFNKAFYLLATKSGWNTKKAFEVMVNANANYWTSLSDFNDAACGVIHAAEDLQYNSADVISAFSSVGVSCVPLPAAGPNQKWLPSTVNYLINET